MFNVSHALRIRNVFGRCVGALVGAIGGHDSEDVVSTEKKMSVVMVL